MFGRYEEEDRVATTADAVREWTYTVGGWDRYKDHQWILSDYDTWERNPHYTGPDQGHPWDDDGFCAPDDDVGPVMELEEIVWDDNKGWHPASDDQDFDDIPF
jgi:hypothetical protein